MGVSDEYNVHDAQWTREKIGRFWDQYSSTATEKYFGQSVGDSLLALVQRVAGRLTDPILDFGCGSGHLLGKLMQRGKRCVGVDYSEESVSVVLEKFPNHRLLLSAAKINGIPTHLDASAFGTVFFVETIEHLLSEDLRPTLQELYRVTAEQGYVVVTTPNAEDLDRNKVTCPDCGCRFHRVQHVSRWTVDSLYASMAEVGFRKVHCQATLLGKRGMAGKIGRLTRLYLLRQKRPHLVYVGQKV